MLDDYHRLIPPHHLVNDGSDLTTRLLAPLGVPVPWSSM
jgi:hypothetical protein